jgi:hypothetical protein
LGGLGGVKLGGEEKFQSVQGNIECITSVNAFSLTSVLSEKGPERAKEWRRKVETLVGCKGVTFAIGDEPDPLIEEITSRIAVEVEMEVEEEIMDGNSDEE